MPQTVEVRFKGTRRAFFHWPHDETEPLRLSESVIVDADRGEDFGRVSAVGDVAAKKCGGSCSVPSAPAADGAEPAAAGCGTTPAPTSGVAKQFPAVLRRATQEEIKKANELRRTEETDRQRIVAKVREHKLEMKVSDVEWQWDRHQMTVFFSAEQRVDFRALVRELASAFRTRIDLRQIGVRDEAARIGGVGRCGREYCCSTWLPELSPVNLSLAKNQSLSLNPSQISGGCGRLLCCLKYEHEFYVTSRKRFPREGKTVETLRGTEKVIAVDIFRERVYLRGADESRTIGLEELREEMEGASGGAAIVAAPAKRVERPEPRGRPERTERPRTERPRAEQPRTERPRAEQPRTGQQRTDRAARAVTPEPRSQPVENPEPEAAASSPKKRRRRRRRRGGGGATGENTNPSGPATE
jgi:cell fate regulator YaaT (PSP1 superfamily)